MVLLRRFCCFSDNKSAVYPDDLTGNEITARSRKKMNDARDFIRCADSFQRRFFAQRRVRLCVQRRVHVRIDHTGRDRIDGDAGRPQFLGQRLCQSVDGGFCRGIMHFTRSADLPPHGTDVDDPAAFSVDHIGQRCLAAEKNAVQIDAYHPPPIGLGDVGKQFLLCDAGIVDQHIDRSEALPDFFCNCENRRPIGNVPPEQRRLRAECAAISY